MQTARYDVITADQATAAMREAARSAPLTAFMGSFPAEWSLRHAVELVNEAATVAWAPSPSGHDLAVKRPDGTVIRFAVPAPDLVAA